MYGENGSGVGERDNCLDKMDIITGTLGKAVGATGGYIVGDESVVDVIRRLVLLLFLPTSRELIIEYKTLTNTEMQKCNALQNALSFLSNCRGR